MYLGGLLAIVTFPLWQSFSPIGLLAARASLLLPGGIDGMTQMVGNRESTNRLRASTGVLLGNGIVVLAFGLTVILLS
jgi:uncharacterized membrane protein